MNQPKTLDVDCPFCKGKLVIDLASGEILESHAHEGRPKEFDEALGGVAAGARQREREFERAFESEKGREDLLAKKFERARERSDPNDNPLDSL